jgi:hypothetical protein
MVAEDPPRDDKLGSLLFYTVVALMAQEAASPDPHSVTGYLTAGSWNNQMRRLRTGPRRFIKRNGKAVLTAVDGQKHVRNQLDDRHRGVPATRMHIG